MNEQQVRRGLAKIGLALRKDRARRPSLDHRGGYMIVDRNHNLIVGGKRYDLTLKQVAVVAELAAWARQGL